MLANYTYDLCRQANVFYHNCPIKEDAGRLAVTHRTAETLETCVELMGLKVPNEM
jgi:arginyl-tRNA synthetase